MLRIPAKSLLTATLSALALAACGGETSSTAAQAQTEDAATLAPVPAGEWIDYDAATFASEQSAGRTILVDVNATWCPTCKAQAPTLDAMRDDTEMSEVVFIKLDFDTHKDFLEAHRVPRQSTILVFQGERETARSIAETDPERLRSAILAGV